MSDGRSAKVRAFLAVVALLGVPLLGVQCRAEFRTGGSSDSRASRARAERLAWLVTWADVVEEEPDPCFVPDARARARIAGEQLPWLVRDRWLGIEMVLVPSGEFEEETRDESGAEGTSRRVAVSNAFYLGRCEVNQEEWSRAMAENPSEFRDDPRLPVDSIAWELLVDPIAGFLHATGCELPTEAEWEWAARGPDCRNYPWGAVADDRAANFTDETDADGDYELRTTPVGSYVRGASWCGALDMAGNVLEWCLAGATADAERGVLRGGAWFSGSEEIRTTARVCVPSGYVCNGFGFRVARRLPPGT
jgi:formylglycine-generating enzyme required for sulfatase activity